MAMIAISLPEAPSHILQEIDVPGNRDFSNHCTLFYLGDDTPIETINKCIEACLKVTEKQKPFTITLNKYTTFPKGKHGYPVICRINCKEIFKLREDLKKELKNDEIEYDNTFPTFKPHVTLSYSTKKVKDEKFVPILWQVNSISIYGGDEGKQRVYVDMPFGCREKRASDIYLSELCNGFYKTALNQK